MVLDFGGNLGFVYFDVRHLADYCIDWWHVVDLPDIVALGNHRFADPKLRFFKTIDQSLVAGRPNIVLCFHVLQYLESPFEVLSRLLLLAPEIFVLHEFPIAERERFMVQHLMSELGGGSRPVRIFSQDEIAAAFVDYELVEEIGLPPWDRTLVEARHVARIYRRRLRELPRIEKRAVLTGTSIALERERHANFLLRTRLAVEGRANVNRLGIATASRTSHG